MAIRADALAFRPVRIEDARHGTMKVGEWGSGEVGHYIWGRVTLGAHKRLDPYTAGGQGWQV